MAPSVGFIGGGRIVRIFANGWKCWGSWPSQILVSDTDVKTLDCLRAAWWQVGAEP